jgi:hypothetical protein
VTQSRETATTDVLGWKSRAVPAPDGPVYTKTGRRGGFPLGATQSSVVCWYCEGPVTRNYGVQTSKTRWVRTCSKCWEDPEFRANPTHPNPGRKKGPKGPAQMPAGELGKAARAAMHRGTM